MPPTKRWPLGLFRMPLSRCQRPPPTAPMPKAPPTSSRILRGGRRHGHSRAKARSAIDRGRRLAAAGGRRCPLGAAAAGRQRRWELAGGCVDTIHIRAGCWHNPKAKGCVCTRGTGTHTHALWRRTCQGRVPAGGKGRAMRVHSGLPGPRGQHEYGPMSRDGPPGPHAPSHGPLTACQTSLCCNWWGARLGWPKNLACTRPRASGATSSKQMQDTSARYSAAGLKWLVEA